MLLPFAGPIPGKRLHHHTAGRSLWQHGTESWHPDSLFLASFPTPVPGNMNHLHTTPSSCDPGDPQIKVSQLGFCPALPPEHL